MDALHSVQLGWKKEECCLWMCKDYPGQKKDVGWSLLVLKGYDTLTTIRTPTPKRERFTLFLVVFERS